MSIAHKLERAAQRWLQTNSDPVGGLSVFRAIRGGGELLEVRCSHSDDGEHPDAGLIVCRCIEETVQQMYPIPMLNAWRAILTVELAYPGSHPGTDAGTVLAWQFVADELRAVLVTDRIIEHLNATGEGILIQGWTDPLMVRTAISGQMRTCEWIFPFCVSELETIEELS